MPPVPGSTATTRLGARTPRLEPRRAGPGARGRRAARDVADVLDTLAASYRDAGCYGQARRCLAMSSNSPTRPGGVLLLRMADHHRGVQVEHRTRHRLPGSHRRGQPLAGLGRLRPRHLPRGGPPSAARPTPDRPQQTAVATRWDRNPPGRTAPPGRAAPPGPRSPGHHRRASPPHPPRPGPGYARGPAAAARPAPARATMWTVLNEGSRLMLFVATRSKARSWSEASSVTAIRRVARHRAYR